jgi:hypothetical protein
LTGALDRAHHIFNVGIGVASNFKDTITALFAALGRGPNIEYIDMPRPAVAVAVQHRFRRFGWGGGG